MLYAVRCCYNAAQFIMILHTALWWLWWKENQILQSQQTPYISPLRAIYGVSIVMILEKMDHVITAPHCILSASIGCCNKKGFFITCGIIMRDGLLGDRFLFGTNNSCSNQAGAIIESAPGKLGIWCEYTTACYTMLSMELRYNSMNDRLTVFILKVTHLLWKG